MNNGWIRLYRVLLNKHIWLNSTPEQKVILITLLLMANHETCKWEWNKKEYEVQRGQFITSINSIVQKCGKGISVQNVRSALKKFEKFDFLTIKSTNENSLVTITNWEEYQPLITGVTNEPTSNQQATNKRLTTNKKNNNDKKNIDTNVSSSTAPQSIDINYENVVKFFNSKTNGIFGMVRYPISEKRKKAIRTRIREHGKEAFAEMINKAIQSDFLKGSNKNGFTASFDWLLKPDNFQKTLEGNYNNKNSNYEKDERTAAKDKRRADIAEFAKRQGMDINKEI